MVSAVAIVPIGRFRRRHFLQSFVNRQKHFADDVVTRVSIEAQDDKMERQALYRTVRVNCVKWTINCSRGGKGGIRVESASKRTYLQLVLSDAVEGEIFVVDGVECAAKDASLDLVMFVGQQLKLDVRIG